MGGKINLYDEMNEMIPGLLRLSGDSTELYAAELIESLMAENEELKKKLAEYYARTKTIDLLEPYPAIKKAAEKALAEMDPM